MVDYKWVSKDELLAMKQDELVTERMQKYMEELNSDTKKIGHFEILSYQNLRLEIQMQI